MKVKNKNLKSGFTLLELLVVVLIIGILASIALPQYRMAVTKAKVASILPLMRRWKDALMEYKLAHGSYLTEDGDYPDADTLGVSWPSDWECAEGMTECENDYWYCFLNEETTGYVYCEHYINDDHDGFGIVMFQSDDETYSDMAGMMICYAGGEEGNKICKALGGKLLDGIAFWKESVYKLN